MNDGTIVILGKNGQVATALQFVYGNAAIAFASTDFDFSKTESVKLVLDKIKPQAIINAIAYTNVDKAEEDEEAAYLVNAHFPSAVAKYCAQLKIPFIHYSTDYVFSGKKELPFVETDETDPINIYGKTKLAGEKLIQEIAGQYLIFRTSWVYDAVHKNFLTTMLKLGLEREQISVVADQIGAPTYAMDLAIATKNALDNTMSMSKFPSGIFHLCNQGETSWCGFAENIFAIAQQIAVPQKVKEIQGITSSEYKTQALRPKNSRLNCDLAKEVLNVQMPNWLDSLKNCMEVYSENFQNTVK